MQLRLYVFGMLLFITANSTICAESTNQTSNQENPEQRAILKAMDAFDKSYNIYLTPNPQHNLEEAAPMLLDFANLAAKQPDLVLFANFESLSALIKLSILVASNDEALTHAFREFLQKTKNHLSLLILKENIRLSGKMVGFFREKDPEQIRLLFWDSMRYAHHLHFMIQAVSQFLEEPEFYHEHEDLYLEGKFRIALVLNSFCRRVEGSIDEIHQATNERDALTNILSFKDFDDYGRYGVAGQLIKQELERKSKMSEPALNFYTALLNLTEEHIHRAKGITEVVKNLNLPKAVVFGF